MKNFPKFKLTSWLMILVFVGPFVAANLLYFFSDRLTFKTSHAGILLSPAIDAQSLKFFKPSLLGKWQLICVESPQNESKISTLKTIQLALGKDSHRVNYQLVSTQDLSILKAGEIGLVDPRGWLMMRYSPETNPQGILKDLRRLLRYSHVG